MRIAIIGAGISGIVAARRLAERHNVSVFEAHSCTGGSFHPVSIDINGVNVEIDPAVLLYRPETYPRFVSLLESLDIPSRDVELGYRITCERTGAGAMEKTLRAAWQTSARLFQPSYYGMLRDIAKFQRRARGALARRELRATAGEAMDEIRCGKRFVHNYLQPLAAALWPVSDDELGAVPLMHLAAGLHNFGLLNFHCRSVVKTIVGGARGYLNKL
ncbi:MAG: NAD(P)-binding protein, partial [Planctomycetales bacterium]|nr:NAD(P)-binding protein [Planctomycetales bacterium]